jgi:hypothetical protein
MEATQYMDCKRWLVIAMGRVLGWQSQQESFADKKAQSLEEGKKGVVVSLDSRIL